MLRNADGGGGCPIFLKKALRSVRFNVINVTRGWVGVHFPGKKRYVTLEWPLRLFDWIIAIPGTKHRITFEKLRL